MVRVLLGFVKPHMHLARPVYGPGGTLVADEGAALTSGVVRGLGRLGVRSVCVKEAEGVRARGSTAAGTLSLREVKETHLARLERELILAALVETANNRTRAAKLLGIGRRTLLYKLKQYGIGGGGPSPR